MEKIISFFDSNIDMTVNVYGLAGWSKNRPTKEYIDNAAEKQGYEVEKYDINERKRDNVYHWSCKFKY